MGRSNKAWRDVVGYEGIYEVSSCGEIRTHVNKTTHSNLHGTRKWKQRILTKKGATKDGYFRVDLWKEGKPQTFLVHRLVAFSFIYREEGKEFVNHKDGNKRNNHVDNLEWCTSWENNNHAFNTGLISTSFKTVLVDTINGEEVEFRSLAKASYFLGMNPGYLSGLLNKGVSKYKQYEIKIIS